MATGGWMGGVDAAGGWGSPTTNYGTLDSRGDRPVIDFDPTTEEAIYFNGVLQNYSGNGLTMYIWWSATSATVTALDVVWGGSIERGNTDIDVASFATEQLSAAVTRSGTSGNAVKSTITFSSGANMDSLVNGEPYRVKLARKVADAGDTMSDSDAEVWAVSIVES